MVWDFLKFSLKKSTYQNYLLTDHQIFGLGTSLKMHKHVEPGLSLYFCPFCRFFKVSKAKKIVKRIKKSPLKLGLKPIYIRAWWSRNGSANFFSNQAKKGKQSTLAIFAGSRIFEFPPLIGNKIGETSPHYRHNWCPFSTY